MTDREERFDSVLSETLREKHPKAAFPAAGIEDRIRTTIASLPDVPAGPARWWHGGSARVILAIAASLALFIGGAEYGRFTARAAQPVGAGVEPVVTSAVSLPLLIQAAGSQYVASLARFSGEAESLTLDQRKTAREVALTVLLSAALELLRASEDDASLRAAADLIMATKDASATQF